MTLVEYVAQKFLTTKDDAIRMLRFFSMRSGQDATAWERSKGEYLMQIELRRKDFSMNKDGQLEFVDYSVANTIKNGDVTLEQLENAKLKLQK